MSDSYDDMAGDIALAERHTVIAGAVFDFMGYLTSRKERIVLSAADEASPAVDAISDFATKRGLSLDNARVRDWVDALAQPPAAQPEQEPVAWRDPTNIDPGQGCTYSKERREKWPHIYMQALYTAPPAAQRPWVELTEEDLDYLCHLAYRGDEEFALTVQAMLKERNHA